MTSLILSYLLGKKSLGVQDIDLRHEASMYYKVGKWSRRTYLLNRIVYDPIRDIQMRLTARICSLALFKGAKMCADYGGPRRPHVKNFLDSAFSRDNLISATRLQARSESLMGEDSIFEAVYFGRLTGYKGVNRCILAIHLARQMGSNCLRLNIIGAGEEESNLKRLTDELELGDAVVFHGAIRFGPELFEKLYPFHLLLAAPLSEDTPRSALDAFACGIPILAFDITYYRDLAEWGAVTVVPWPDTDQFAAAIHRLESSRELVVEQSYKALEFTGENTQEIWLQRRANWTLQLFANGRSQS